MNHFEQAEKLLETVEELDIESADVATVQHLLAKAQVHATLAAAFALRLKG